MLALPPSREVILERPAAVKQLIHSATWGEDKYSFPPALGRWANSYKGPVAMIILGNVSNNNTTIDSLGKGLDFDHTY